LKTTRPDSSQPSTPPTPEEKARLSRRGFLSSASGTALFASTGLMSVVTACGDDEEPPPPSGDGSRAQQASDVRSEAAKYEYDLGHAEQTPNGDETRYADHLASYSKGLPHNSLGIVDAAAYTALVTAITSGKHEDFEKIPKGGTMKQVNPQAAYAFELVGPDPQALALPAPPAFASAETAGEMAELYWMALTRDIPYSSYETDPLIAKACQSLSKLTSFKGPKEGGQVTPRTLFRNGIGDLSGPYASQFLLLDVPSGSLSLRQLNRCYASGTDFLTAYADWQKANSGTVPGALTANPTPRYLNDNRALATYVHGDVVFQAFWNAMLIMLGMRTRPDASDPYAGATVQSGGIVFSPAYYGPLMTGAVTKALKPTFYQKWVVHRRLRPEVFGARVHNKVTQQANYDIHAELLESNVLADVFAKYGTYLLPMAYPEGSPTHPSYPAAHAAIAGVCVTILKACFDESFVIPNPMMPNADGTALVPYTGGQLTVGGELNKLAYNISYGRNIAGVHYRSDGDQGLRLGEEVAIRILREEMLTYNEKHFGGFSLTKFDGTTITV
jgi:hypothetical protein